MNLAQSLLGSLEAHGAREVFGIPGDFALPFFKVAEESAILPLYTFSHEPAVGFAADAAARYGSRLGVAAVTYGAGAFNLVNAVVGAYAERSPVVVISGAPGSADRATGFLLHHQARTLESQFRVYQEITCAQAVLNDPAAAPGEIARVLRTALDRSLPVYLELPRDMAAAPCEAVLPQPARPVDQEALCECTDEILDRIAAARSPVMMVGVEVRRYALEAPLAAFAHRTGIPVVTSFLGRGLMNSTETPAVGTYLGVAGDPELTAMVEDADLFLLLGVILSDTNFGVSARHIDMRRAIHALDRQVRVGHHVYPDLPLADLARALAARAAPTGAADPPRAPESDYPHGMPADGQRVTPDDIAAAVNDLMAERGPLPLTSDVGDCLFTAMDMVQTDLAAPGYYAGMGFGVPGGLGAQAATGRRPLILVGDGAFQMTGWELGNCRRYGWDPIVLLFNNRSWEMLRVFQPESRFNDLDDWRFAELAAHLGGDGVRVETRAQLRRALEDAVARRGRFQLIEVMLERGAVSRTLGRFVAGVARMRGRAAQDRDH